MVFSLCEKCIHKRVCAKYSATGGLVSHCEHYAEERHGRWFPVATDIDWCCSVCDEWWHMEDENPEDYHYCPNCGARMDLEG